jgi:broad specificity phosphatase PhoE
VQPDRVAPVPTRRDYNARMGRRLLYLTRHGETDWNAAGRWQGHTDIPLNAKGRTQAEAVADTLRGVGLSGIVSSDLSRAYETARIVGERLGLPVAYVDTDLRERAFGPFEGLTREECVLLHPEAWRAWTEEHRPPEGAEGRPALAIRVTAAIGRVARQVALRDAPALVVTHGGALRAAVALATGSLPAPVANGAIWRIEWDEQIVAAEALVRHE